MILVDTGPLVALFDPKVAEHSRRREVLQYRDHPMDLADASLIAVAEVLPTRKVFTLDRNDFSTYRVRRGHRHLSVEILG